MKNFFHYLLHFLLSAKGGPASGGLTFYFPPKAALPLAGLLLTSYFLLLPFPSSAQFYNGSQLEFGKSRVQYHDYFWYFYRYENFNVYFYSGGKDVADYISRVADTLIDETEKFLDYTMDDKIFFIVYNNLRELQQSNIGFFTGQSYNTGGVTHVVGTKVFLYHNGSYTSLRDQLKSGIAETLLNQMMFGGNLKDRLKSATLLSLPDWYSKGLVSYCSGKWTFELDNYMKDAVQSGKFKRFNRLAGEDAAIGGHAIWNYIAERYGPSIIPGILYMTKLSRNVESGFLFVLGTSLKTLTAECLEYYRMRAEADDAGKDMAPDSPIISRARPLTVYSRFKVNPDSKYAVYTSNTIGKYKVWLYEFETGKSRVILKGGYKREGIVDYSYPLTAWHPSEPLFAIIRESKGKIFLSYYSPGKKTRKKAPQRELHHLGKILDFAYSPDGNKLVLSAVKDAQNDIFVYGVTSNLLDQVTNDIYDDRYPSFSANGRYLIFCSDRPDDTLKTVTLKQLPDTSRIPPINPDMDIFIYDFASRSPALRRLTGTPLENETYPFEFSPSYFTFLSDRNGVTNRFILKTDSVISAIDTIAHYRYTASSYPFTNFRRNVAEQYFDEKNRNASYLIYDYGNYKFYSEKAPLMDTVTPEVPPPQRLNNTFFRNMFDKWHLTDSHRNEKPEGDSGRQQRQSLELFFTDDTTGAHEIKGPHGKSGNPSGKDTLSKIDIDNYFFEEELNEHKKKQAAARNSADSSLSGNFPGYSDTNDYVHAFRISKQWVYFPAFMTDYFVSQVDNSYTEGTYQKFTGGAIYTNPGLSGLVKIGISDILENYRVTGGFRLSGDLKTNEYLLSVENLKYRLDRQFIFHRQMLLQYNDDFSIARIQTHELKCRLRWPFSEITSLTGNFALRNDRITTLATGNAELFTPTKNEYATDINGQFIFDNTISRGMNLYYGTRFKLFAEIIKHIGLDEPLPPERKPFMYILGFDWRHYLPIHRDFIWANRFAVSASLGEQKLIYYLGGVDAWIKPKFDKSTYIDPEKNYTYQTLATNMRGFHQNVRNGNSFAVINSELRMPVIRYFYPRPIRSDFLYNLQIIGFTDIGTAWTGLHPYSTRNSLNTRVIIRPPLVIRITEQRDPIVAGYGFGVRSRIWGYFLRVDWAQGIEEFTVLPHMWYVSLSLDF